MSVPFLWGSSRRCAFLPGKQEDGRQGDEELTDHIADLDDPMDLGIVEIRLDPDAA